MRVTHCSILTHALQRLKCYLHYAPVHDAVQSTNMNAGLLPMPQRCHDVRRCCAFYLATHRDWCDPFKEKCDDIRRHVPVRLVPAFSLINRLGNWVVVTFFFPFGSCPVVRQTQGADLGLT
jgi:hypothetical protein